MFKIIIIQQTKLIDVVLIYIKIDSKQIKIEETRRI